MDLPSVTLFQPIPESPQNGRGILLHLPKGHPRSDASKMEMDGPLWGGGTWRPLLPIPLVFRTALH